MTNIQNNPVPGRGGWFRSAVRIAIRCVLGVILAIAILFFALQIPPIARWSARTALAIANPWKDISTSLDDVRGNWLTSLELINLRISNARGTLDLSIDTLSARYSLTGLLWGKLRVEDCALRKPVLRIGIAADGSSPLTAPSGGEAPTPDSATPFTITIDQISLTDGEFHSLHDSTGGTAHTDVRQIVMNAHGVKIATGITASLDSLHAMYLTGERDDAYAIVEAAGSVAKARREEEAQGAMAKYLLFGKDVRKYVSIVSLTGLIVAVVNTILLFALGVDYPVLWGVLAFLLNFVPTFGFIFSLIPPALLALIEFGWERALIVVVGFFLINAISENVIKTRFMAKGLDVPLLLVIISLLVWTWVLGPMGTILGVPLTLVLYRMYMESVKEGQAAPKG